jgi:hypothetical protein
MPRPRHRYRCRRRRAEIGACSTIQQIIPSTAGQGIVESGALQGFDRYQDVVAGTSCRLSGALHRQADGHRRRRRGIARRVDTGSAVQTVIAGTTVEAVVARFTVE